MTTDDVLSTTRASPTSPLTLPPMDVTGGSVPVRLLPIESQQDTEGIVTAQTVTKQFQTENGKENASRTETDAMEINNNIGDLLEVQNNSTDRIIHEQATTEHFQIPAGSTTVNSFGRHNPESESFPNNRTVMGRLPGIEESEFPIDSLVDDVQPNDDEKGGFPFAPPAGTMGGNNPPLLIKPNSSVSGALVLQVKLSLSITSIVLTAVGVTFNIPSMVVFTRSPDTVTNKIMIVLLAFETTCLVVNLPISAADIVYLQDQFFPLPLAYFRLGCELTFITAMKRAIIFLTAIMTVDRFLTTAFPLLFREGNLQRPKLMVSLVLCFTMAYTIVETVFRWDIIQMTNPENNSSAGLIIPSEEFRTDRSLLIFFVATNILCQYIPTFILVLSNLGLLVFLIQHKMRMQKNDVRSNHSHARPIRSVGSVLAYSVVTLALNLPLEIYMSRDVFNAFGRWGKDELPEPEDLGLMPSIVSCVNVLSWSGDFFIYWSVSSRFRESTKRLFVLREVTTSLSQNTPVS